VDAEASIREHILALEQRLLDPDVRQSASELEQLLADEFLEFGSSGSIYRKPDVLAMLQLESPQLRTLLEFHVLSPTPDVVLATYRLTCRASPGAPAMHSLRSSVWRLKQGKWQLLFHQGTPCARSA